MLEPKEVSKLEVCRYQSHSESVRDVHFGRLLIQNYELSRLRIITLIKLPYMMIEWKN